MAVTDKRKSSGVPVSLKALTAAALALPGIVPGAHADGADGAKISLEYHHYAEGKRDLDGQSYSGLNLTPLQADSVALGITGTLRDSIDFGLNLTQDTWSGATPVTTLPFAAVADQITSGASIPTGYYEDSKHRPVDVNWSTYDGTTVEYVQDPRLVHVMASASPETRRQADSRLAYEGGDWTVGLGGGVSEESDYHSRFVNGSMRWDRDQKLTTVSLSASFTKSFIDASLEANSAADWGAYQDDIFLHNGVATLYGKRSDFSATLGISRIIDTSTLVETSIGLTRGQGYLSNPYKATVLAFDDPDQFVDSTGLRFVVVKGTLEQRPRERTQWTWDTRLVRYVESADASLHLDYRYYHDNWRIGAHTLDLSWYQRLGDQWTLIPGVRYYSQSAAFFYRPYFLFDSAFPILLPRNPELPPQLDHSQIHLPFFASDERLSGFGTLSASFAVSRPVLKYATLELGGEYTKHAGSLKLGGRGEGRFADFNAFSSYLTLSIDMSGEAQQVDAGADDTADVPTPAAEPSHEPAALPFERPLGQRGALAFAMEHESSFRGGSLLFGSEPVQDVTIQNNACAPALCIRAASRSTENVSRLQLSFAPVDWLTVTLSPSFIDRHEEQRELGGGSIFAPFGPGPGSSGPALNHVTGALGDTALRGVVGFRVTENSEFVASLGLSIPTGSVHARANKGGAFESYGLQPGSGTWDLEPGIAVVADYSALSLGAEINGRARLQSRNSDGYGLGNSVSAIAWSSYRLSDWLNATMSGAFRAQGAVSGGFKQHWESVQTGFQLVNGKPVPTYEYNLMDNPVLGPSDNPLNYGGDVATLGLGLGAVVPDGVLQGNRFSIEWQQPVWQHMNGYQLSDKGTISVSWELKL